jgi:hypothetical protein
MVSFSITHQPIFALVSSFIIAAPSVIVRIAFGAVASIWNGGAHMRRRAWQFGKE